MTTKRNGQSVIFTEKSANVKLGKSVAATYAPVSGTCPTSCPLMGNGCYAQLGFVGIQNYNLEKANKEKNLNATELAREEAKAIDASFAKGVPENTILRVHVSGDSRTVKGTRAIASAVGRWLKRGGKAAWSYTHAWKTVPRTAWGKVSVLASVTTVKEAQAALKAGYAPAIVVDGFKDAKAFMQGNVKFVPCPQQTRDVTCDDCGLCMNADKLKDARTGIAFMAHGVQKNKVGKVALKVLTNI